MKRLFHYTRLSNLRKILADRKIIQADTFVKPPEMPVVWFSYRQDWEPTATPGLIDATSGTRRSLTFEEFASRETPARIEIDPQAAPLNWRAWRKSSGVKSRTVKALEESALRQDADTADWRVSFEPVSSKNWFTVEVYVDGEWIEMEELMRAGGLKPFRRQATHTPLDGTVTADAATAGTIGEHQLPDNAGNIASEDQRQAEWQQQFEQARAEKLSSGRYGLYLCTFASHERLKAFTNIIPRLTDREYWQNLREVWTGAEVVLPDKQIWLRLLQWRRPEREHLMTESERVDLAAMPDTLEIWRGCGHESAVQGLSWTLDPAQAAFFTDYACGSKRQDIVGQSGTKRHHVKATCCKSDVLAYFTTRNESEIVVNPAHVTVLRTHHLPKRTTNVDTEWQPTPAMVAVAVKVLLNQPENQPAEK